ncbi:MAG: hypothetical protein IKU02_04765 [Bacteroidaceae bacterium]|nr:hypothetical protein [Bacteroidaceae bacterium]
MKTSKIIGILFGATLLLSSCYQPNVVMKTVVDWNGNCTREVSYSNEMSKEERDSELGEHLNGWSQPVPMCLNIDAFCKSKTVVGEGDTVTTTFEQVFKSVSKMCEETPLQLNGTQLKSNAQLKKHFRWFYTDYTFTETFYCVGDIFNLADTVYASNAVMSYWFTGEPNLVKGLSGAEASQKLSEIEPLVTRWLNDNLFQVGFDYIVANYDSIPNPPVNKERFIELHDSLAHFILADAEDPLDINPTDKFREFFHSDAYSMFFGENTLQAEELTKELEKRMNIFCFNVPYTLVMPGKVVDAGNGSLQPDGSILYPFTGERLIPEDYTITATSRKTNVWAYIVSLLIILLAAGSFFYRKRK